MDESLFGFDIAYSFFLVFSMFFLLVQQVIYLSKCLVYTQLYCREFFVTLSTCYKTDKFVLYAMNVFRFNKRTKRIAEVVVKLQYVLAASRVRWHDAGLVH